MRSLCILLTAAGGGMIPGMAAELRDIADADVRIVTVDVNDAVIGQKCSDAFYRVPGGSDAGYADALLAICRSEKVDIVIPLSDEEAVSLAAAAEMFEGDGVVILGSSIAATSTAGNKLSLLQGMQDAGKATPAFRGVSSISEFDTALSDLGYPEKAVVCKPVDQRGGRGFRVIRREVDELSGMFFSRREIDTSADRVRGVLDSAAAFPGLLMMEYLDGTHFSVDVLIDDGVTVAAIAQRKYVSQDLSIVSTEIVADARIEAAVEDVVSCFEFNHLINIDMAERSHGGEILTYEVNVRPSALIAGATVTGRSLLCEAVSRASGFPSPAFSPAPAGQRQHIGTYFV
jgi:carbamoyl-phosphate synthase large subunit